MAFSVALVALSRAAVAEPPSNVAPVTVIGATPLSGANIDAAKAPYAVNSLSAADLEVEQTPGAISAMNARIGALNLNDNLDDPFQPDVLYRGFEASAVLGTPAGLAVYQGGVRINEAFGDTVNWDLIPTEAIARLDVVGTNPVYGLNALGGAIVIGMKTGFDHPGGDLDLSGGSFGRRSLALTYGVHSERLAAFVAVTALDQDGWRFFSGDRVRQLYADVSARTERLTVDLAYTGADNRLLGEGATPVQELAIDRRLTFTTPQVNTDRLDFATLTATYAAGPVLSAQANAYVRHFRQGAINGNTTNDIACAPTELAASLCQPDGQTPLVSVSGAAIPDLTAGGTVPIGENDREDLDALSFGGTVQGTSKARVLGRGNQLTLGAAADRARVDYGSNAEVGVIDSALVVQSSGFIVSTPEGSGFTATPVGLRAEITDLGAFGTDTLDLTRRLSITASGRYNAVRIVLGDQRGSSLSGTATFARFNPALGATYRFGPGLTVYAGYAEGSRAPTPSEIECSDPRAPCLLPSSLSADPPNLKQVVSRTFEAGMRGESSLGAGRLSYSLGLYRTEVHDDIYGVATSLSAGYFRNIPGTRRQGFDVDLALPRRSPDSLRQRLPC